MGRVERSILYDAVVQGSGKARARHDKPLVNPRDHRLAAEVYVDSLVDDFDPSNEPFRYFPRSNPSKPAGNCLFVHGQARHE